MPAPAPTPTPTPAPAPPPPPPKKSNIRKLFDGFLSVLRFCWRVFIAVFWGIVIFLLITATVRAMWMLIFTRLQITPNEIWHRLFRFSLGKVVGSLLRAVWTVIVAVLKEVPRAIFGRPDQLQMRWELFWYYIGQAIKEYFAFPL